MRKASKDAGLSLPSSVRLPLKFKSVKPTDDERLQGRVGEIQQMLFQLCRWAAQHPQRSPEQGLAQIKITELFATPKV